MKLQKPEKKYSAPIIYKAFAILEEIAANRNGLGISDLARRLNMSKGTVHGIIKALLDLGVVTQGSLKKFSLGPALIKLGSIAMAGEVLRVKARPYMEELYREFGETVFLGTFDGRRITIIEKVERPFELKISAPIGTRIPLFAGAAAKVFLSGLSDQDLQSLLASKEITMFTQNSITGTSQYIEEIKKVKEQGFATDCEEYINGVNAVSVPIKDSYGRIAAAIWMVGFSNAFNAGKMELAIEKMLLAAKKISII